VATKTLIVLRHAKSSWRTPDVDFRRPLAERGIEDARTAGALLSGYDLDLVLCSAATRARQTWENAELGGASCERVEFAEAIYHAWPDELLSELRDLDEATATVLLIGHQPTLSDLVLSLSKPSDLTREVGARFPTCALSVLTYRGGSKTLDRGKAVLKAYEIPRA